MKNDTAVNHDFGVISDVSEASEDEKSHGEKPFTDSKSVFTNKHSFAQTDPISALFISQFSNYTLVSCVLKIETLKKLILLRVPDKLLIIPESPPFCHGILSRLFRLSGISLNAGISSPPSLPKYFGCETG